MKAPADVLTLSSVQKKLLRDVYECQRCSNDYGFSRPSADKPYFKFPPIIGATGRADLLFVGTNPRKTKDNEPLYQRLTNKDAFARLSRNRDEQTAYIAPGCKEAHYHHHVAIVEALYGKAAKFEDHAAVTELFFCGSKDATNLPPEANPCADAYFDRVFLEVCPKLVVCVWERVFKYFRDRWGVAGNESFLITIQDHAALVVFLPHQNRYRHR